MTTRYNFDELKKRFLSEVKRDDIIYYWDNGHCWSSVEHHPVVREAQRLMAESSSDLDRWYEFTSDWLSDNEGDIFCYPELLNELIRKEDPRAPIYYSCACASRQEFTNDEDYLDYLDGFTRQTEKRTSPWYTRSYMSNLDLLKKYIAERRDELRFDRNFDQIFQSGEVK